ncbi:hypothetical protein N656DRAFT_609657 [Canariomyces notabilis]|uniref:Uncharacterized protein n=1 Tax=Canariomyces notabilis TaxID=2074819 RepID=A0AAN6TGG7_9PEZI|nr:hypothetical protein N656DRAFT_609657 [Canariomyces arenarius]
MITALLRHIKLPPLSAEVPCTPSHRHVHHHPRATQTQTAATTNWTASPARPSLACLPAGDLTRPAPGRLLSVPCLLAAGMGMGNNGHRGDRVQGVVCAVVNGRGPCRSPNSTYSGGTRISSGQENCYTTSCEFARTHESQGCLGLNSVFTRSKKQAVYWYFAR